MSHLEIAIDEILDNQSHYLKGEQYYEGNMDEVFASPRLKRALKKTGTSFRFNFSKIPVRSVLNRLSINSLTSSEEQATQLIDQVWEANDMDIEADEVHENALKYGDAYLMVWPNGEDIEVSYNSPLTTRMFYDSSRNKLFAAKMWAERGKVRLNIYFPDRIEKYISKKEKPEAADFGPYVDDSTDENGILLNPFGEIPVFHFATARPYGTPEHKDAYGPQDAINKLVTTNMATTDFHGFPQRYALAGNNPSTDATEFDSNDKEQPKLSSGAGELWWLEGVDKVGQFDAADVKNFLEPMREYIHAMATITETPLHHFEYGHNAPSGESLRVAEAPLIKRVQNRQTLFGTTWKSVFDFVLAIKGVQGNVIVDWKPAESSSTKSDWETAKIKIEAGVPFPVVLREMGYNEREIDEILQLRKNNEVTE